MDILCTTHVLTLRADACEQRETGVGHCIVVRVRQGWGLPGVGGPPGVGVPQGWGSRGRRPQAPPRYHTRTRDHAATDPEAKTLKGRGAWPWAPRQPVGTTLSASRLPVHHPQNTWQGGAVRLPEVGRLSG